MISEDDNTLSNFHMLRTKIDNRSSRRDCCPYHLTVENPNHIISINQVQVLKENRERSTTGLTNYIILH